MSAVQDRIERSITINAPIEKVWPLVSRAGWWIGDGDVSQQKHYKEGELDVVEDPKYGTFRLRALGSEPYRYVSYQWVVGAGAGAGEEPGAEQRNATLVEFWLSELTGGATLVRVMESGFASLAGSEEDRRNSIEGNTAGWRGQLDILKARAEHVAV